MDVGALANMNERELLEYLRALQVRLDEFIKTQQTKEVGE